MICKICKITLTTNISVCIEDVIACPKKQIRSRTGTYSMQSKEPRVCKTNAIETHFNVTLKSFWLCHLKEAASFKSSLNKALSGGGSPPILSPRLSTLPIHDLSSCLRFLREKGVSCFSDRLFCLAPA